MEAPVAVFSTVCKHSLCWTCNLRSAATATTVMKEYQRNGDDVACPTTASPRYVQVETVSIPNQSVVSTESPQSLPVKTYPFQWTPISKEERMQRRQVYFEHGPWCVSPKASMLDLISSTPGNVLMPRSFMEIAEEIYNFQVRQDDVFIVTYPKCGTTLTQEMVWQIQHGFDLEKGKESLMTRSPFLEMQALTDPNAHSGVQLDQRAIQSLETAKHMPSPRVIKTHLPIDMLPPNLLEVAKVVFVARNPMDCCVSFFHHEKLVPQQGFSGTFDQYAELFRNGKNPMGDYFYHLKSGWNRQNHANLKFLWFEDIVSDMHSAIQDMAFFLGKSLSSESLRALASHLQIDNFRKNNAVNMEISYGKESNGSFIRRGSVGGWRDHFSDERVIDWAQWIESNTHGSGLELLKYLLK